MILVTGASGQLGKKVAQQLEQAGAPLRLMVRDRNKAPDIQNAEVVEGNYTDPASLQAAFNGIERAFIVSLHERPMERAKLHRNAFMAAAAANVAYVVYTSFQGAAEDSEFSMGRDHCRSETYLKESGLTYTALRNNYYMETAHEEAGDNGLIRNPAGDGRVAWVSRDDIAQVAAHLLLHPMQGATAMDVTGPDAPKLSELAKLLSELSGKPIEFQQESYEEGLAWRATYGLADWNLEAWISSDMAKGKGEASAVSDTVQRLLGRKACSLREFYKKYPSYVAALRDHLR